MPKVFTYGSDALQGKMFDRIGPSDFSSAAVLPDHELVWNKPNIKNPEEGLPNIVPAEGKAVEGALFELSRNQLEMLDGFFGGYQQVEVRVRTPDGHGVSATTWIARRTKSGLAPSGSSLADASQAVEENAPPPPEDPEAKQEDGA